MRRGSRLHVVVETTKIYGSVCITSYGSTMVTAAMVAAPTLPIAAAAAVVTATATAATKEPVMTVSAVDIPAAGTVQMAAGATNGGHVDRRDCPDGSGTDSRHIDRRDGADTSAPDGSSDVTGGDGGHTVHRDGVGGRGGNNGGRRSSAGLLRWYRQQQQQAGSNTDG